MRLSLISIFVSIFAAAHMVTAINGSSNKLRETSSKFIRPTISDGSSARREQDGPRSIQLNSEAKQIVRSEFMNDHHSTQTQNRPHFQSLELHERRSPLDRDISRDQSLQQPQLNQPTKFSTSGAPSENGATGDLSYNQHLKQDSVRTFKNHQLHGSNGQSLNQQQLYNRNQQIPEGYELRNAMQEEPIQVQHYNDRQNAQTSQFYNARPQTPSQQQTYNTRVQSHEQQKQIYSQQSPDQQKQIYNTKFSQPQQENFYNVRQKSNEQQNQQIYNLRQQSSDQKAHNYNVKKQFSEPQQQLHNLKHQLSDQQEHLYSSRQQSEDQQKQIYNPRQQFNEPEKFYSSHQQPYGNQKQLHNTMQKSQDQQPQLQDNRQQFHVPQTGLYNRQQSFAEPKPHYNTMQQPQDQQQFNNAMHRHNAKQQPHEQSKIHNNMHSLNVNNQDVNLNNYFKAASIDLSQVRSGSPIVSHQDELAQITSKDLQNARKDIQVSAIENRELARPLISSINSATVGVSGLSNLYPDMVNNGEHIPPTHVTAAASATGRDASYKKSASLSQHLKTPFARYEFSHTL